MTISSTKNRINHTSDGVQTTFTFDFQIDSANECFVYLNGDTNNPLSGYTINGLGNPNGGNIVFSPTPPPAGTLTIQRLVPLDQQTDYIDYDRFPANTHERALDKLTKQNQQQQDQLDRSLTSGITTPEGTKYELPFPESNRVLQWNQAGNNLENGPTTQEIEQAKTDAQNSANAAATSAANAATSESNAATSASNASTSETNAATSASNASTSETNAAASAATAQEAVNNINYYDIHGGFIGIPAENEKVTIFPCVRSFQVPLKLAGTQLNIGTNPSANTVLSVRKNDVEFATISIDNAGAVTLAGTQTDFVAGDLFTVVTPANLNGLSDVYYTVVANAIVTP